MGRGNVGVVAWRGHQVVLQGQRPARNDQALFEALRAAIAACRSYQRLQLAVHATAAEWGYVAMVPSVEPAETEIVVSLRAGDTRR